MKNLMIGMVLCASVVMLAGCETHRRHHYGDNGYYSSGYTPGYSDVTSGYNRDYQSGRNGYSSSGQVAPTPPETLPPMGNDGYSSSGSK